MALDTPADRLQWARKRHGQYSNPTDAARAFGWTVSTYLGHENGDRNPSRAAAKRYGRAYRVRWEWILEAEGSPDAAPEDILIYIPMLSWVSAGNLADAESQIHVEDVPLLAFADLGQGEFFALRVEGDSMDRLSPHGSTIVVNRADRELVPDKPYVFWHRTEGTTFKLWRPAPDRLQPSSWNGVHQPTFIRRKTDYGVIGRVKRSVLDL